MSSVIPLPKLDVLVGRVGKSNFHGTLLAVDPGETTGITVVRRVSGLVELIGQDEIVTWPMETAVPQLTAVFGQYLPTHVVYEAYHIYGWKLKEHSFSEVPTIQIIGCLKTLCIQRGIRFETQTAQTGKAFFKDDTLKKFDMYYEGARHARDSLRHAAQFLTFGIKTETP